MDQEQELEKIAMKERKNLVTKSIISQLLRADSTKEKLVDQLENNNVKNKFQRLVKKSVKGFTVQRSISKTIEFKVHRNEQIIQNLGLGDLLKLSSSDQRKIMIKDYIEQKRKEHQGISNYKWQFNLVKTIRDNYDNISDEQYELSVMLNQLQYFENTNQNKSNFNKSEILDQDKDSSKDLFQKQNKSNVYYNQMCSSPKKILYKKEKTSEDLSLPFIDNSIKDDLNEKINQAQFNIIEILRKRRTKNLHLNDKTKFIKSNSKNY